MAGCLGDPDIMDHGDCVTSSEVQYRFESLRANPSVCLPDAAAEGLPGIGSFTYSAWMHTAKG